MRRLIASLLLAAACNEDPPDEPKTGGGIVVMPKADPCEEKCDAELDECLDGNEASGDKCDDVGCVQQCGDDYDACSAACG